MFKIPRRWFLKHAGSMLAWISLQSVLNPFKRTAKAAPMHELFVSKNGTPETNMQRVIEMAGGIEIH